MNLVKFTMKKLIIVLCTSMIMNEIIPYGWKVTDNLKEKQQKNSQKNYKK